MKRIAWLTDLHLNFLESEPLARFFDSLRRAACDALMITGDIAEAVDVLTYLEMLAEAVEQPIYFVLGNHDFYRGSIHEVRQRVTQFCAERPQLHYLTVDRPLELAPGVGIVGHDGWADGRLGNYEQSPVVMADFALIEELISGGRAGRWPVLQRLADEGAAHIRQVLPAALDAYERVFVLTHVPPLREACWHEGRISNDEWAPHFTSKAMGDAILEVARQFPQRRITVLCGHTHGRGECAPLPNVEILTGGAVYGAPAIERIFEL